LLFDARTAIFYAVSTLAEIETAAVKLPATQQQALFAFLAARLGRAAKKPPKVRRGLKAAACPALDGLPADLSTGTKERVLQMVC
jgi:hypothetical protein